jgi:hypothetical protein
MLGDLNHFPSFILFGMESYVQGHVNGQVVVFLFDYNSSKAILLTLCMQSIVWCNYACKKLIGQVAVPLILCSAISEHGSSGFFVG